MSNIQYTIRNIPPVVDKIIRKRSKQNGKSFNQTVVDLLALQTLGSTEIKVDNNFDWLFGANTLDKTFDAAIKDLSRIDEQLWQ
jgi:hypothetical protein